MAFVDIFKDKNDFNEKTIVGFLSFSVMAIFAGADVVTGIMGKEVLLKLERFSVARKKMKKN